MKRFLVLIFIALSGISCAATSERLLHMSTLSAAYERTQPACLAIKNVGPDRIRVYSDLEFLEESGRWITWPFRVEDGRSEVISKIYPLSHGESIIIVFDIRKIVLPPIPDGEKPRIVKQMKFRFRVTTLAANTDAELGEEFSEPFVVQDPFGQAK